MKIQSVDYANEEGGELLVKSIAGEVLTVPWPCKTWHGTVIQEWADTGGVIGPFVPRVKSASELLHESDQTDMPRIAEDLIDTLIAKGVIVLTDLPQASQGKIAERKALREKIG